MKEKTLFIKLMTMLCGIVLISVSAFSWYFIPIMTGKSADDVLRIEIRKSGGFAGVNEYCIIDFTDNSTTLKHDRQDELYRSFSEQDKENFICIANSCRFFTYDNIPMYYNDCFYFDIRIEFSDNSVHTMRELPHNIDLCTALRENFGCDII